MYATREEKTPNDGKNAGQISEPPDTVAILVAIIDPVKVTVSFGTLHRIDFCEPLLLSLLLAQQVSLGKGGGEGNKKPSCASSVPHISLSEEKGRHKELKK